MFSMLLAVAVALQLPSLANAHFLWLVRHVDKDTGEQLHLYFSELAESDDPDLLDRVADAKVWQVDATGETKQLSLEKGSESLLVKLGDAPKSSMFVLQRDLGVMERGGESFLLRYYAKTGPVLGSNAWEKIDCGKHLALDLIPTKHGEDIRVTVKWHGTPVSGAQVKIVGPGMKDFEALSDEHGQVTFTAAKAGVHSIRAKHTEDKAGETEGNKFTSTRHYSTLALHVPPSGKADVAPLKKVQNEKYPAIPEMVTSFGAAIADGSLYVYGGHTGRAHSYSDESQAKTLRRLDLKHLKAWESLGEGPGLQGLALVAHGNKLYRLGGFIAKNKEGDDNDLWSQADVATFDVSTKQWQEMSPLPEPRSSFDAAVLGDKIYVIGGWQLAGESENIWHKSAYVLDLAADASKWESLPEPPFQRRALAVAAHDGKLYAIGGMQETGGPTTRVDVYDPQSGKWSQGPSLIGEGMDGFGASAFATGGQLYVSTYSGKLQRLAQDGKTWEVLQELERARFFHRMLPLSDTQLISVGGASMQTGKFEEVDVIDVH
ncbi:MAG: kelch repeat-containing protein [Planctomycetota bacterium]